MAAHSGPTSVNPHIHDDKAVGDEAMLHAAQAPTIIARARDAGVKLAELNGADCVFMDNGFCETRPCTKAFRF